MLLCMLILAMGKEFGKQTMNRITVAKITLITFMTILAFSQWDSANLKNGFPVPATQDAFGWEGVIKGSATAFFGYIGFDEVCCLAAETKNPGQVMHSLNNAHNSHNMLETSMR